jgi:AcrR family transcriptional regulator
MESAVKRARTDEAKDARRQALLDAALEEFFDRGFSAARTHDIAQRAGLSKGTLYLYFDSKEAVFAELIESLTSPNLARIEEIAETATSVLDAIDRFTEFAPHLVRTSDLPRLLKVLIGDSQYFPDTLKGYREKVLDRVLGAIGSVLEAAKARGEIEIGDPHLAARLVIAPVVFSGLWQAMFSADPEAEVDLEALFREHARLLRRGMEPRGGRDVSPA